jgi:arsenate reductase
MTARRLAAEFLGTAGLLLAIVGSGITAASDGAASAQLMQHAIVVGAALAALILTFGPISGAHFNPAVTVVDAVFGGVQWRMAAGYVGAQLAGAICGVMATNLLFGRSVIEIAATERTGLAAATSESVATFGLLIVIFGVVRSGRTDAVPAAVGVWIAGAIYFTPSASFANPAVTVGRMLSDTYTGIAPSGVPGFLAGQLIGAAGAAVVIGWLFRAGADTARDVVVPHPGDASDERPDARHVAGKASPTP